MNFRTVSFNHAQCGEYHITKGPQGYYAWRVQDLIRTEPFDSFEAARAAIEQHARENP